MCGAALEVEGVRVAWPKGFVLSALADRFKVSTAGISPQLKSGGQHLPTFVVPKP